MKNICWSSQNPLWKVRVFLRIKINFRLFLCRTLARTLMPVILMGNFCFWQAWHIWVDGLKIQKLTGNMPAKLKTCITLPLIFWFPSNLWFVAAWWNKINTKLYSKQSTYFESRHKLHQFLYFSLHNQSTICVFFNHKYAY